LSPRRSNARETLDKAQFFVAEAREVSFEHRPRLERFVEAAIVFGRSVTFHLQKEYSRVDGFEEWYAAQQESMRADAVFGFFLHKRNFILKEGSLPVRRAISISVTEVAAGSVSVSAPVTRASPWYRRGPGILLDHALRPLRTLAFRWTVGRGRRRQSKVVQPPSSSEATVVVHFDDPDWGGRDALKLIEYYLASLRPIVEEAERRFGQDSDVLPSGRER